jgi:hypothetical protein
MRGTFIPVLALGSALLLGCGAGSLTEPGLRPGAGADSGPSDTPGGATGASKELCDNQLDDDRDGWVDEGCACDSTVNQGQQACYSGPVATRAKGACHDGKQRCIGDQEFKGWGRCSDEVTPQPELDGDGIDNDCDGQVDTASSCADRPEGPSCSCALPWGGRLAHGRQVEAFSARTVPCGSTCLKETRKCQNGVLSGSHSNPTCATPTCDHCELPWGGRIADGAQVMAFEASTAPCGGTCLRETRKCQDGVLSGGPAFETCSFAFCVTCPAQTLTAPTDQPGVTCTDTMEEGHAGEETFSPRPIGQRCRGPACSLMGNVCDDTPYRGTVVGGRYGTCQNWCAVRARCNNDRTWTVTGWTW